jgi:hypothetical protein
MDLFAKVVVVAIVLIIIAAFGFWLYRTVSSGSVLTEQQAVQTVLSDQALKHPNATISVINVTPSTVKANSWDMVLSIVDNGTRPCPTLSIEEFDYPAFSLLNSTVNTYTKGCKIYGGAYTSYKISTPAIAIVESYTNSSSGAASYVSTYGYNNTVVHARNFTVLESNMTPLDKTLNDVWLVNYTATGAGHSLFVILNYSGAVVGSYTN